MDIQTVIFTKALCIADPIYIEEVRFEDAELHIYLKFYRGSEFPCPICGRTDCKVRDTADKTWRHLNFFQYKCFLHGRILPPLFSSNAEGRIPRQTRTCPIKAYGSSYNLQHYYICHNETVIFGIRSGLCSNIRLNFSQLIFLLPPLRFNTLNNVLSTYRLKPSILAKLCDNP